MKVDFKKILPHVIAVAVFAFISILYNIPAMKGEKIGDQHDMVQADGMTKEATDYYNQTKDAPLWSNAMFSGMPTYVTFTGPSANHISFLNKVFTLWLPEPANMIFLAMLGMYFLLCVMGLRSGIGIIGGIAYGFSSYNLVIIVVGHITKMMCMAYMAPVLAGIWLVLQGRYLLGGIITALMLALLINNNHLQVTYYTMLIIGCIAIAAVIYYIVKKQYKHLAIAGITLAMAAAIGALPGSELWMVQKDYAQYTMRGSQSELTPAADSIKKQQKQTNKGGLDIDYAYRWSYGKYETFTFLIPRLYGGGNFERYPESFELREKLEDYRSSLPPQQQQQVNPERIVTGSMYFGEQPGTAGTVYFGAIICFLFVLSLFVIKSWHKWWLVAATVIGIVLSWGHNFMAVNEFLFNNLPLYNKFRAPTISLIIPQLTFVVLGCWALHETLKDGIDKNTFAKKVLWALGITAGLAFALGILGSYMGDFSAASDKQFEGNRDFVNALRNDRASALRNDGLRSFFFILGAAGMLMAYLKSKLKWMWTVAVIAFFVTIDMLTVASRYLYKDKFVEKTDAEYKPTVADNSITQDKTPYYRVLNLASDPFNDALPSYLHKAIGGYSPAKLWIYQDLIENQIYNNIQNIGNKLQAGGTMASFDSAMMINPVLNMLNTKYVITNDQAPALLNRFPCGNAWFVNNIKWAANANEEMASLTDFNPKTTAVIDKRFTQSIGSLQPFADSTSSITLTKYGLNALSYESKNSKDGLGVFSEIWYPGGWKAYIDGKETKLVRVNYALRAMVIPAGNHKIEMKFEPEVFFKARKISSLSSYILLLLVVGILGWELWKWMKKEKNTD